MYCFWFVYYSILVRGGQSETVRLMDLTEKV